MVLAYFHQGIGESFVNISAARGAASTFGASRYNNTGAFIAKCCLM